MERGVWEMYAVFRTESPPPPPNFAITMALTHAAIQKSCSVTLFLENIKKSSTFTYLEHLVRRGLDARHHVCWSKSYLLHLRKVVLGVSIQDHLPHWDQREVLVRPHLQVM